MANYMVVEDSNVVKKKSVFFMMYSNFLNKPLFWGSANRLNVTLSGHRSNGLHLNYVEVNYRKHSQLLLGTKFELCVAKMVSFKIYGVAIPKEGLAGIAPPILLMPKLGTSLISNILRNSCIKV